MWQRAAEIEYIAYRTGDVRIEAANDEMDVVWLFARLWFLELMFMRLCAVACTLKQSTEFKWKFMSGIVDFQLVDFYYTVFVLRWNNNEQNKWSSVFYFILVGLKGLTFQYKWTETKSGTLHKQSQTVDDAIEGTAIVYDYNRIMGSIM